MNISNRAFNILLITDGSLITCRIDWDLKPALNEKQAYPYIEAITAPRCHFWPPLTESSR